MERFVIAKQADRYLAWPDLALTCGGKLLCLFTACNHHSDRDFSQVMICESLDRGRTWTQPRAFSTMTMKERFWNNARIQRLRDDSLLVVCDLNPNKNSAASQVCLWRGDAEGRQWEGPMETCCRGIVPDRVCELPDGKWLLMTHWKNPATDRLEVYAWRSADQGAHWTGPVSAAADPELNLCEASAVVLRDNRVVVLMRENSGLGRDCYKVFSSDGGEHWEGLCALPLPGTHRPVAGRLQSGQYLITYRMMQGGKGWLGHWTQNTMLAWTDEASMAAATRKEAWTRIMPLDYDRSPRADCGYTGWVQFPDGEIYIVNYLVDDAPVTQIRGYSLREEEILLPE